MKQKILLLLLAVFATVGAYSQTKMIIHQKSGSDVEVALADKPVATYEGDVLVLTTANTTLNFTLSAIDYVNFEESSSAIESITVFGKETGPSRVYDLDGRLVKTVPEGESVIISSLPQGMYIVKNNVTSYKITKR